MHPQKRLTSRTGDEAENLRRSHRPGVKAALPSVCQSPPPLSRNPTRLRASVFTTDAGYGNSQSAFGEAHRGGGSRRGGARVGTATNDRNRGPRLVGTAHRVDERLRGIAPIIHQGDTETQRRGVGVRGRGLGGVRVGVIHRPCSPGFVGPLPVPISRCGFAARRPAIRR